MPSLDFLSQDTSTVCFMTKFLWKTVVKHIDLFFDIINSHNIQDGITQIELIQRCLPQFRVEAITLRSDIKDFQAFEVETKYERNSRMLNDKLGLALNKEDDKKDDPNVEKSGFDLERDLALRLQQASKILGHNWLAAGQKPAIQTTLKGVLSQMQDLKLNMDLGRRQKNPQQQPYAKLGTVDDDFTEKNTQLMERERVLMVNEEAKALRQIKERKPHINDKSNEV